MRKRSKTLYRDNIDGVLGAVTYKAIQEREFMEKAIREPLASKEQILAPLSIGGKQYGEVKRKIQEPQRSPYNCPNCCAPIVKDYCEYCGTRFGFTVVRVDGFKKREELQRLKDALNGEKQILYADNKVVAEFQRFGSIAHELGDTPGTTTQYR